jgi:hypothetical protein
MLFLERPLGVVDGLALFGDHADAKRVYYVPTVPRLAVTAGGAPEMSFVKFRDAAAEGGTGLLSFTTELVATDQQLERAREHLEDNGVPEVVLAQVPWITGKAYLAAALQEGDGFVEKLYGQVTPDLAATNRALFSMRVNQEGARLVEAMVSMQGPSPLGVRYELEYAGLRPALDAHIEADYKRVYDELSWGFQIGVAYQGIGVRAAVESATQKLRQVGAIKVEVMHFTDRADLQARVDAAIRWLQDRILRDFFTSSLQPPAHENMMQRAIDAAMRLGAQSLQAALRDTALAQKLAQELGVSPDALSRLSSGQGGAGNQQQQSTFSLQLQFTYRDIKQEELKTISLDWREAHAERRTAAPQGLLSRMTSAPPTIVEADASSAFWERLNVSVRPLGNFPALGVQRLIVQLAYPDEQTPAVQKAVTFSAGDLNPKPFSAWTDGKPPRYRARTEVHFDDQGPWPGPPQFTGEWRTLQSLELGVHPLSESPRLEIEIAPGTLRFDETPQAQVDLRIGTAIVSTHMLLEGRPTATFKRRLEPSNGAAPPIVEARTTWFLAGGPRVEGAWTPVEGTTCLVHRPWQGQRTLRVLPMLPGDILDAIVTLTIEEGARIASTDVRFAAGERTAKTVTIPTLTSPPPPVQVDVLVIRGDGTSFSGERFESSEPVIVVRDRDGTFRQIGVRLLAAEKLSSHGLMAVQVQLVGEDGDPLDQVVFTETQRAAAQLLVPTGPDSPKTQYRVIRYALDGTAKAGAPQDISGAEVLVPAVAQ